MLKLFRAWTKGLGWPHADITWAPTNGTRIAHRRQQLVDTNQELVTKVKEAQGRVRKLQDTNGSLKEQYTQMLATSS